MTMANMEEPSASSEENHDEATIMAVQSSSAQVVESLSLSENNDPSPSEAIAWESSTSVAPLAATAPTATPVHPNSEPENTLQTLPMASVEVDNTACVNNNANSNNHHLQAVVVPTQGYHLYQPGNTSASLQHTIVDESASNPTDIHHQQQSSDNYAAASPAGPSEEEKEEIITNLDEPLAGMPTYEVDTSYMSPTPATVLNEPSAPSAAVEAELHDEFAYVASAAAAAEEDESELAALKRAAAFGGTSNQKPRPTPTESLESFFERTCEYWNAIAVDRLSGTGDIDIDRCMEESMRLAREQYDVHGVQSNHLHGDDSQAHQQAMVVEISDEFVHPSDLMADGAVRAEVMGEDYSGREVSIGENQAHATAPVSANAYPSVEGRESETYQAVNVSAVGDETAEATVIDSAPEGKQAAQYLWQNQPEEAQVIQDTTTDGQVVMDQDRKPAAVSRANASQIERNDGFAVAEQEAEVVGIEEDVHPSEIVDSTAQAEVVGTDFNYLEREQSLSDRGAILSEAEHAEALHAASEEIAEPLPSPRLISADGQSSTAAAILVGENAEINVGEASVLMVEGNSCAAKISDAGAVAATVGTDSTQEDAFDDFKKPPLPPRGESQTDQTLQNQEGTIVQDLHLSPPPSQRISSSERHLSTTSSDRSHASQGSLQQISSSLARGTGNVVEALFGDRRSCSSNDGVANAILPRTLLPWSVIRNASSNMWIATLQTNQKALDTKNVKEASKSLRAFSLPTEAQAVSLARSWTPPRMLPFESNPLCHICQTKFAVFRRSVHCRNCGVCVCKNCCVQWPNKMIPETYNIKKENVVNVCKSCNWASHSFRVALLEGKFDEAVALHATGNVNLTCPFANVKGEEYYPVHCAVLGGSLEALKWLVDEHCCPIKSVRVNGKTKDSASRYTAIVTSKGRSLLGIAMGDDRVEMIRYLVVNKNISLSQERDITPGMLMRNLEIVLRMMPDQANQATIGNSVNPPQAPTFVPEETNASPPIPPSAPVIVDQDFSSRTIEAANFGAMDIIDILSDHGDPENEGSTREECIICFDNPIDCVATPCGHQICCTTCASNISRCPVCAQDCDFLRVFKP